MKDKQVVYFKYAFIAICVIELVAEAMAYHDLIHMFKPLLMPALLIYFRKGTSGSISLSFILAVFAIVFSFVGDSLLMYAAKDQMYFMLGLGGFAVAQLLYTLSFNKAVDAGTAPIPNGLKALYALPFVLYGLGLLWLLWDGIGDLQIPVAIYSALIMTMAVCAVLRNGRSSQESVNQVILGAVFFVLSDSLLAFNKFYAPMENAGVFIMITYLLAQWNIINGLQKHYNQS